MLKSTLYREVGLPLYEYKCRKCGKHIEKIQKFSDAPLQKCESCGGKLERLISPPAIQFKGTGWYVTDYGRKGSSESTGKAASKPSESKSPAPASKAKTPAPK